MVNKRLLVCKDVLITKNVAQRKKESSALLILFSVKFWCIFLNHTSYLFQETHGVSVNEEDQFYFAAKIDYAKQTMTNH